MCKFAHNDIHIKQLAMLLNKKFLQSTLLLMFGIAPMQPIHAAADSTPPRIN